MLSVEPNSDRPESSRLTVLQSLLVEYIKEIDPKLQRFGI
jgi:hypothetical protein